MIINDSVILHIRKRDKNMKRVKRKFVVFNIKRNKIISIPLDDQEVLAFGHKIDPDHSFTQIREYNKT